MFRALWIKHWAQLRTLRWVGFGLGVVLGVRGPREEGEEAE